MEKEVNEQHPDYGKNLDITFSAISRDLLSSDHFLTEEQRIKLLEATCSTLFHDNSPSNEMLGQVIVFDGTAQLYTQVETHSDLTIHNFITFERGVDTRTDTLRLPHNLLSGEVVESGTRLFGVSVNGTIIKVLPLFFHEEPDN